MVSSCVRSAMRLLTIQVAEGKRREGKESEAMDVRPCTRTLTHTHSLAVVSAPRQSRPAKRAASRYLQAAPSASHYVGYVEDEENVEMIMKKFEAMEEYKRIMDAQQQKLEMLEAEKDTSDVSEASASASTSNGERHASKPPSFSETQVRLYCVVAACGEQMHPSHRTRI
jgi:hypothetical protein